MPSLFATEPAVAYAQVAVERGVDRYPRGLTYAVPPSLSDLAPGERIIVPLGRGDRPTPGYVVELLPDPPPGHASIKPVMRRDQGGATLPAQLLALAAWMSRYYCTPIGMTLASMLPAAVKRRIGAVTRTLVDLADGGTDDDVPRLSTGQRQVIDHLAGLPPEQRPVECRALARQCRLKTTGPIRRLIDRGMLTAVRRTSIEAAWSAHATDARAPERLTADQQRIVDAIAPTLTDGFAVHLVNGVTGSGKTEVYIRLIETAVGAGRVALLLVPEISLTPQTAGRILGRFPQRRVAILHSGLTAAQRHQQWSMVADGLADIIIGARSAVFAPVPDGRLGLIIVDEEHDGSYKQDQAPRYHGRDAAVRRGQLAGVPVLLGSATPSLESWHNATERGTYHLHELPERAPGLTLPRVQVVDLAEQRRQHPGRGSRLIGPVMERAIGEALDADGQVLILLNRRGYACYISCPDDRCGWVMICDQCDVTMVFHRHGGLPAGGFLRCHHCLSEQRMPKTCPDCHRRLTRFGFGTQRVEEDLARTFPQLVLGETMLRLDSDTMRSARHYHDALSRFGTGRVRALVGTQMIAKGLDYPGVRVVGVINADTALNLPDFRAAERTFQLVSQVAGRCGRGRSPGRVIVQTFHPDTAAIALAAAHDYRTFADRELAERRRCSLPPITRLARIIARDEDHRRARDLAVKVADDLRATLPPGVRPRGPSPCPIARIAGRYREQIELLADSAAVLQQALAGARSRELLRPGAAMAIDVDPIALL